MQTNYPRIYSLSTLGIIYHFNSDYKFHELRTDFTGDGGSGKTMIADMIQLILVGNGAFKSATESNDPRPPEGMVLKPKNNSYGAGYIFLNLEVGPAQFIVIGAFIEKSSRQVRMFIGQKGFNWDSDLEPLSRPIFYNDMLVLGKIVPVEEIQHSLQRVHIKAFSLKQYHNLLYQNNILPINLSENKRTLESFANIYRSFSRGSGFKKDSGSLKTFLFGEDEKNFVEKYQAEIKSISEDYHEHDRFRREIDSITQKQDSIKYIFELEQKFKKTQLDYFTDKILFWANRHAEIENNFKVSKENYDKLQIEVALIAVEENELLLKDAKDNYEQYKISSENLLVIEKNKKTIDKEKEAKYAEVKKAEEKKNKIEKIEKLLTENGNSIEKTRLRYNVEIQYKADKERIEEFSGHLNRNNIKSDFENSPWFSDFANTWNNYETFKKNQKEKLNELKALLAFSDLQNPDSLATWALKNFNRPLSREEESVLHYFQKFPRAKINIERFLNSPDELFSNLDIKDKEEKGFWLNMNGVYEYIAYIPKQYLNINEEEKKELKTRLVSLSKNIQEEYQSLEQKINQQENLKVTLLKFSGLEKAVELYIKKMEYEKDYNKSYTTLSQEELDDWMSLFKQKTNVLNELEETRKEHEMLIKEEAGIDPQNYKGQLDSAIRYFSDFDTKIEDATNFISVTYNKLKQTQEILRELIDKIGIDQSILPTLKSKLLENAKTYIAAARLKLSTYTSLVNFEGIYNTASNELQEAFENTKEAKDNFQAIYKTQIIMPEKKQLNVSNPDIGNDSLKKQFEESKGKFESEYNTLARNIEEGERLLNTFHTGQLAHKLLPTVFVTPMLTTKDQLDTQLGERLNSLYNSIRAIGVRKIEILKRVFTEVNRTYRDYLEKINAIDTYFKNPNKGITSGNKASIKSLPSRDYPAKWMTVFNKMLDDQVNNIGLFEQLAKEIDINEMMKQAFISENGTKTATIEDLLDPKSYFDLEFNLKLESGDSNSGSNSQTYSLNALLGLARLSLIEDHNRRGIRIMPIDEAQGLGSNYEMLREIAIEEKYQILTMSIDTAGNINKEEQYMYIFSENKLLDEDDYVPAMGIFNGETITPNIGDFIYEEKD